MAKKKRKKKTSELNYKDIGFGVFFLFMATANYVAGATGMIDGGQGRWVSFAFFIVIGIICLVKGFSPTD